MRTVVALVVAALMWSHPSATSLLPDRLSRTGLYQAGTLTIDPRSRAYSPQYPLWSDRAVKSRWVQLPPGARIRAEDVDEWDLPVGTRFWKEFSFGGRKVETRILWRATEQAWSFGAYVWNEEQTDALLAPSAGVTAIAEVAPGKRHRIPSVDDCRACHENGRSPVLGFTALQLSSDRDPAAPHAEPLAPGMVTLRTLVDEHAFEPPPPEFTWRPPRIPGDRLTRAALGYLSANCGMCHNARSAVATVPYPLKMPAYATDEQVKGAVRSLLRPTTQWDIPGIPRGTSHFVTPGAPDLSALVARMRSRRPSSQMPPLGTVVPDHEGIALVSEWIRSLADR
jgi:hypothetical protein